MKKIFIVPIFLVVFLVSANLVWGQAASKALGLDVPKITKNNLKITKLDISSVEIQEGNTVKIDGTFEIQNYADTDTSELYFSEVLGIKGGQYFLQYPLQQDTRSERFVIPAKQTITKSFTLSQKDIAQFADLGVEIRLFDTYNKKISARAVSIETFNTKSPYTVATSTSVFILNEEEVASDQFVIYSPEKETLQIKASVITDSEEVPIGGAILKIYEDTYYQNPIQIIDAELVEDEFVFTIPQDLKPGRYVFETSFNSNNSSIFVPRVYGEFLVNGNLNKITEVSFEKKYKTMSKIIATVQGTHAYTDATSTTQYMFDTEFILYDKEGQEIWKTIKNQDKALFFRNIEVELDTKIKLKNISKIKVNLIKEGEVFDSFEKEVVYEEEMNVLILIVSMFALLIGIILFKKFVLKNKNIAVCFLFLLCMFGLYSNAEAGMTPPPSEDLGWAWWDNEPDSDPTACGGSYGCPETLTGTQNQSREIDIDVSLISGDGALGSTNSNLIFHEPIFVQQDPNHCYNPGETIPLVFSYVGSVKNYLGLSLYIKDNTWFSNLIPHLIYSGSIYDDGAFNWSPENTNRYSWKKTDLSIWANFIQNIETQSGQDYVADPGNLSTLEQRRLLNINDKLIYALSQFSPSHATVENIDLTNKSSYTYQKTLIAPENPGLYDITLSLYYSPRNYSSSEEPADYKYIARHQISVCDTKHDADFTMPGSQTVDSSGVVRDENGAEMPGYTVYSPSTYLTHKFVRPTLWYAQPYPSGQILGFDSVPTPKFSFVTIANYCGYRAPASTWTNSWVNLYSTIKNTILNTRAGYDAMSSFSPETGSTRFAVFAYKPYPLTGTFQYYDTTTTSTAPLQLTYSDWYVHNENGILKFIDLDDVRTAFNNVVDLNVYSNIPRYSLGQMLSNRTFNPSADWIDASNNTSNTYIVKENLKFRSWIDQETTCSIYEDFCPTVPGIQYIHRGSGLGLGLYNLMNGQRILATSTPSNATKAQADGMCSVIPVTPSVTVSCDVSNPVNAQDRNPGIDITFVATAGNIDPNYPLTTYIWTNATVQANQNTAVKSSYQNIGLKNDVIVEVSNNGNTATTTCPVEIVPETLPLTCTANPAEYTLQVGETSKEFTFTYSGTNNRPIASQAWKDEDGALLSTDISHTEIFSVPDTYQRTIFATSNNGATGNGSCFATLKPDGTVTRNPILTTFIFNPNIIGPPDTHCPLFLDIGQVTSCTLTNSATGAQTVLATTSPDTIFINGSRTFSLGTWNLTCTGIGTNALPRDLGVQKCMGNSGYREI